MTDEVSSSKERIEIVKDNRNIIDNTKNQKLNHDDIEKLKSNDNMSGDVRNLNFTVFKIDTGFYIRVVCFRKLSII